MTLDLFPGDRVCLHTDPQQATGTVLDVHFGVATIRWDTGRHWRYCLRTRRLMVLA